MKTLIFVLVTVAILSCGKPPAPPIPPPPPPAPGLTFKVERTGKILIEGQLFAGAKYTAETAKDLFESISDMP